MLCLHTSYKILDFSLNHESINLGQHFWNVIDVKLQSIYQISINKLAI